ncbi:unnamed protein product [Amaranthus hypochondriacus]
MAYSKLIMVLFFTMFYFLPYIITAQQQPFTALVVPFQNLPKNGSAEDPSIASILLSMHNNTDVLSKRWLYFCFGVLLGGCLALIIGGILYFFFGKKKINESPYYEAQEKGFKGEHVVAVKKV